MSYFRPYSIDIRVMLASRHLLLISYEYPLFLDEEREQKLAEALEDCR